MAERTGEGDCECQAHVRGAVKDGAMHGKIDRQEGEEGKKKTIHCSSVLLKSDLALAHFPFFGG